jgi:hypothetical protein
MNDTIKATNRMGSYQPEEADVKGSLRKTEPPGFLTGWKEIASYLDKGVRTVQRYERQLGLPVRRPAGKLRGSVVATKPEIDAWVAASPIREAFYLPRITSNSVETTWASLENGAAEMRRLRDQMQALRMELRSTIALMHTSVQGLHRKLRAATPSVDERVSGFDLLAIDMGRQKPS